MASKKEEPEWLTDKMDDYTIHTKNSKVMRDFFSSPKGVGNPLESHGMMMLDMSDKSSWEYLSKQQVPTFPEVRVVMMDDFTRGDITKLYKAQRIVIRSRVRVPDDEGNNYFTMVKFEMTIPGTDSIEERSNHIGSIISRFNMDAYAMILLGVPDPTLEYNCGKGIKEPLYIPDNNTLTERERIKEMAHERGYPSFSKKE